MNHHEREDREQSVCPLTEEGKDILFQKVCDITAKGRDVEVRRKKDGLAIYEIKKKAV